MGVGGGLSALPADISFETLILAPSKTMDDFRGVSVVTATSSIVNVGVIQSLSGDVIGVYTGFVSNYTLTERMYYYKFLSDAVDDFTSTMQEEGF